MVKRWGWYYSRTFTLSLRRSQCIDKQSRHTSTSHILFWAASRTYFLISSGAIYWKRLWGPAAHLEASALATRLPDCRTIFSRIVYEAGQIKNSLRRHLGNLLVIPLPSTEAASWEANAFMLLGLMLTLLGLGYLTEDCTCFVETPARWLL